MNRPHSPQPSQDHAALISALGGATTVAEIVSRRIGLAAPMKPQAVSNWLRRGIPYRYRAPLAVEARERGIGVPVGFLGEEPAPPAKPEQDDVPFLREGA